MHQAYMMLPTQLLSVLQAYVVQMRSFSIANLRDWI